MVQCHRLLPLPLPALLLTLGCSDSAGPESAFGCPAGMRMQGATCVVEPAIAVNSVGYLPGRVKRATITAPAERFVVRDADGGVAFEGAPSGPFPGQKYPRNDGSELSEPETWTLDFTDLDTEGEYTIEAEGAGVKPSPKFRIGPGSYDSLLHVLMLGMTGQRCGMHVEIHWEGEEFAHGACHIHDGALDLVGAPGSQRDGTAGWHDAGDYGKYTVNGAFSTGMMLMAWEHFPQRLLGRPFEVPAPEGDNEVPDYLDEIRYNLDWLLKMQNDDGTVAHKLSGATFESTSTSPLGDTQTRYFSDWSTAATADFVAVLAQASRIYQPFDAEFAARCLAAAQKSYDKLITLEDKRASQQGFANMQYNTDAGDDRAWAACELWETTGNADALAGCESAMTNLGVSQNFDWSGLSNLAVYRYVLSRRPGRDPALVGIKTNALLGTADLLASNALAHKYGLAYTGGRYWGVNGVYARTVMTLQTAYLLDPKPEYLDAGTLQIDHLLGQNVYGRSQVTGIGHLPPKGPHHRPSSSDDKSNPWPGLLIGGGQPSPFDWTDNPEDATTAEIAINWNAALIYAVAAYVE